MDERGVSDDSQNLTYVVGRRRRRHVPYRVGVVADRNQFTGADMTEINGRCYHLSVVGSAAALSRQRKRQYYVQLFQTRVHTV